MATTVVVTVATMATATMATATMATATMATVTMATATTAATMAITVVMAIFSWTPKFCKKVPSSMATTLAPMNKLLLRSNNNFINFCQGKTLTNGAQVRQGSCNGIVMGNIPAVEKMVSSVFVQPQNGDNLPPKQEFDIQVQMANFAPGTFTNATSNYYSAPQDTNGQGFIIGHTHVTVQDTGRGLNPQQPLNPQEFVFFKGINDAGNGQGLLSAKVAGGLPPGNYRADSLFPGADGVFQGGKGGRRGQAGQRGLGGASQSAAVGGVAAAEVVQTNDPDRPFSTLGNSFTTQGDAVQRSCDAQRAACQEAVQSGTAEGADASACDAQLAQCISDLS
ncbi:hypothetical protein CRV24_004551 [Beauveria bassiana]|nr:hypothetical protein CRV24_004551 [Beauveria bassiana]